MELTKLEAWLAVLTPQGYARVVEALGVFRTPHSTNDLAKHLDIPRHAARRICRPLFLAGLLAVVKQGVSNQAAVFRATGVPLPPQPERSRRYPPAIHRDVDMTTGRLARAEAFWRRHMGASRFEDHPRSVPLGICRRLPPPSDAQIGSSAACILDGTTFRVLR